VLLAAVHPGSFPAAPSVVNPLGIQAAPWLDTALTVATAGTVLVLIPACLVTVVIRWRRAAGALRYRLGLFVAGYAAFVVLFIIPAGSVVWDDVLTATGMTALFAGIAVGTHVTGITERLERDRQQLIDAREDERRRLHRDLHDGVGPELAGLALQLSALSSSVQDPVLRGRLVELQKRLRGAVGEVRRTVDDLRAPALDELGLVGALRARAEFFTAPGVFVCTLESAELPPLSAALESAAWKITTEAVSNAARHSHAARCCIRLHPEGDHGLVVEVEDNGTGVSATAPHGVGMDSMRARARELGGVLQVLPGTGGGTLVRANLPGAT
jgi:signal transduction histidine kinase